MTPTAALLGGQALAIIRAAGRQPHARWTPTQGAVVLEALGHPHLRDAILAQLLDHQQIAEALAYRRPADVRWLTEAHPPDVLDRAQQVLDRLEPTARTCDAATRDAVLALRGFLLWSQGRPTAALTVLTEVSPSHGLGKLVRQLLVMGIQPVAENRG